MVLLWYGEINLNRVPTSSRDFQCFWKPFENYGLCFLYSNANSILPKLDELKTILGNAKAAVISTTESKIDNSVPNAEIWTHVTAFSNIIVRNMGEELHLMLGKIYVSIWEIFLLGHFNINFLHNGKDISK